MNVKSRRHHHKNNYIDVGDQKFISLSSDGFAFSTVCGVAVLLAAFISMASSDSSLMFETTDVVELVTSRCRPNRLDKNHPVAGGGAPAAARLVTAVVAASLVNCPVKYGFGATTRRIDFGEPIGEAGNDFDPRRDIYLGFDMNSVCTGSDVPPRATVSG